MTKTRLILLAIMISVIGIVLYPCRYHLKARLYYTPEKPLPPITLDEVYVISLDRTPQRYFNMRKELDKLNIKHTKFTAVDGYNIKITDENDQQFSGEDLKNGKLVFVSDKTYTISCRTFDLSYNLNRKIYYRALTSGELGCYCSHREIWREILDKKSQYALALEDDASFSDDFMTNLNEILNNTPQNWHIIFLYNDNPNKGKMTIANNPYLSKIIVDNQRIEGTGAYLISHEGAKKLFQESKKLSAPVDFYIGHTINGKEVNAYIGIKRFVSTPGYWISSTIEDMGRTHP